MHHLLVIWSFPSAAVFAAPASPPYTIHEKRSVGNPNWQPSNITLDKQSIFPLSIGLTQRNLDKGHDYFMNVADPESPNYAKHWTAAEVADAFRPTSESIDSVKAWLAEHGIGDDRIWLSKGYSWLRFNATVGEAETLLRAEYKVFEHSETKIPHLACDEYSIPESLRHHIDFITPTTQFDAVITKSKRQRRDGAPKAAPDVIGTIIKNKPGLPTDHVHPGPKPILPVPNTSPNPAVLYTLANCNQYTTPACLRALYNIPVGTLSNVKASMGVVEFTPQAYNPADMDIFYSTLATNIPKGIRPVLDSIDGGTVQTTYSGFNYNAESNLDLQYAIALVYPQKVTLYQVGDMQAGGSFGTFLYAIDATYCTSNGGDDPSVDPQYPNNGYKSHDCGKFAATSVISISYSYNEPDLSVAYEQRQCNEYLKLGLQGITVLVSSGDYGVASNSNQCCTYINCALGTYNSAGDGGAFTPSFPSTCPYVTSVGATQIKSGAKVTAKEVACETVIHSGGGFSNVFPAPSYQTSVLKTYFARHTPNLTAGYYNLASARGYPDISANGANYAVAINGVMTSVYGTSASTPVVASIISLINQQRVKAGKNVVGAINPVLYANKGVMNDVTSGSNAGCLTTGFSAVSGWDPVTGLGTPDYVGLLKVFMKLP